MKELRKSLDGILHMILDKPYPKPLPELLVEYHVYVVDSGHCICAIPKPLFGAALSSGEPWMYEVPIPARYVLHTGWERHGEYLVVDVPYDDIFGVEVDERQHEY